GNAPIVQDAPTTATLHWANRARFRERADDAVHVDARRLAIQRAAQGPQQLELRATVRAAVDVRDDSRAGVRVESVVQQIRQQIPDFGVWTITHRETPSQRASRCGSAPAPRLRSSRLPRQSPCTTILPLPEA